MEVRGNLQELVLTKLLINVVIQILKRSYAYLENSGYILCRQDILLKLHVDRLSSFQHRQDEQTL